MLPGNGCRVGGFLSWGAASRAASKLSPFPEEDLLKKSINTYAWTINVT